MLPRPALPAALVLMLMLHTELASAQSTATPRAVLPGPERVRFVVDPVADGALLSLALGVGASSDAILGTREITPQQPRTDAEFLFIDRDVIESRPVPAWASVSNVGAGAAFLFAGIAPIESGLRYDVATGIVDAFMYAESMSITWAATNLTKIAVRRPRPSAYREQRRLNAIYGEGNTPPISGTNTALSFFSGHTSITATVAATATYLAFARQPATARPWLTLGIGSLATSLVAVGRVKSGKHFPTDVIAGAMAGIGIGILVPHLHREASVKERRVWIGLAPTEGGGVVQLQGQNL